MMRHGDSGVTETEARILFPESEAHQIGEVSDGFPGSIFLVIAAEEFIGDGVEAVSLHVVLHERAKVSRELGFLWSADETPRVRPAPHVGHILVLDPRQKFRGTLRGWARPFPGVTLFFGLFADEPHAPRAVRQTRSAAGLAACRPTSSGARSTWPAAERPLRRTISLTAASSRSHTVVSVELTHRHES